MLSVLCFRHLVFARVLFRVWWCLRLLLQCYFCLSRNGPDMVPLLTFVFFSKSFCCFSPQFHGSFFFRSFLSQSVCSESSSRNFDIYCIAPRNDFSSFVFFGEFSFNIASIFSSFGLILYLSISCPSHFVRFMKNSDFLLLALYPAFSSLFRKSNSFFLWSCLLPRVTTIMSSSPSVYSFQVFGHFS